MKNHPDEQLLDAKLLRLFDVLYTTGSVTKAAELLGQSQPTVSPVPVPSFVVKQHWHTRFHHDPANRWLRSLCAKLFLPEGEASPAAERAPDPEAGSASA